MLKSTAALAMVAGPAVILSMSAAPASAILLADFETDTGAFQVTPEVTASVSGGELHVVTQGGFRNAIFTEVARTGTSVPNQQLTAPDLRDNPVIQWDWRSDDAGSAGTFIGNHLVLNTDVNGFGYQVLNGSFRFIPPNQDTGGSFEYDLRDHPGAIETIEAFINGAPSFYFQLFVVQQTDDNAQSTVHYDEFRAVPEPAALSLLCLGGLTLARRRRRR